MSGPGSGPSSRRWGGSASCCERTVPGLAHAFTFWGFTILLFTILEAYGDLFDKNFFVPAHRSGPGPRVHRGLLRRGRARVAARVHRHPLRQLTQAQGPELPVLRFAHRGGVAGPGDDRLGHGDPDRLPGRPDQHRRLPLRQLLVAFRLPRRVAVSSSIWGRVRTPISRRCSSSSNMAVIMGFLVFLAYSKHLHILLAPINVATSRRPLALGPLYNTPDMDMENVSEDTVFGAGHIEDLSLEAAARHLTPVPSAGAARRCARRGTPASHCPRSCSSWGCATTCSSLRRASCGSATSMELGTHPDPAEAAAAAQQDAPTLVPTTIDPDVLWSCLTCGACVEECPVDIEHVDTIVDMRRYEVLMESRFPSEAGLMLRNIENQGDPWGLGGAKRTEWTAALDFEIPVDHRHHPRRRRVPLLGGVRRSTRRAGPQGDPGHGAHAASGRGPIRHPRPSRVLHG